MKLHKLTFLTGSGDLKEKEIHGVDEGYAVQRSRPSTKYMA